ncbi:unnamed protein product, partial [Pylaiella littoralis]
MAGRGASSSRGPSGRGRGREARALQGWLQEPLARRRSLASFSSSGGEDNIPAPPVAKRGRGSRGGR